jgi:hypothetical protein
LEFLIFGLLSARPASAGMVHGVDGNQSLNAKRNHLMNHTDKTIPYRLSPAELENLRIMRKRTKSTESIQGEGEEEKTSEESDTLIPESSNQNAEKKIP